VHTVHSLSCTVVSAIICGIFITWFLLSIAAQLEERVHDWVPQLSGLGLIPRWAFFAPRPAMDDTHLLYRDRFDSGTCSEWSCLTTSESRRWFHAVWNPRKFHSKVIDDLMSSLVTQKRHIAGKDFDDRALMLTVPYIALLHFVMRVPHPEAATARQFVVVHNRPYSRETDPAIGFVSEFHPFSKAA
jgi:hypothetical protein